MTSLLPESFGVLPQRELAMARFLSPEPFHFACDSPTWDVLKTKFEVRPAPEGFFSGLLTSKLALDFYGVNIFIDESVPRGQVDKRPGRSPPKTHGEKEDTTS